MLPVGRKCPLAFAATDDVGAAANRGNPVAFVRLGSRGWDSHHPRPPSKPPSHHPQRAHRKAMRGGPSCSASAGPKGSPSCQLGSGPRPAQAQAHCRPGIKWEIVYKGHRLLHKTKTQKQRISSIPKKKIKPGGASASPDVPTRGGQSPGPCCGAPRRSPQRLQGLPGPWKDLAARGSWADVASQRYKKGRRRETKPDT
jgi:hypothetical protein